MKVKTSVIRIGIAGLSFTLIALTLCSVRADVLTAVDTVLLPITVQDSRGHLVEDLKKEEVKVLDGKNELSVVGFEKDEGSIKYVLAMDTSGSFRRILPDAVNAARFVVNQNRPEDETGLIRFVTNEKIEKVQDFTSDKNKLIDSLGLLYVEGGPSGVTDAIYLAVQMAATPSANQKRRAVVLITDGEDRHSFYKFEQLQELLRQTRVEVFVIGMIEALDNVRNQNFAPTAREKAKKLLSDVATESFGRAFFPRDKEEIQQAASEIAKSLHVQFYVAFRAIDRKPGTHKVDIKLTRPGEKLTLLTQTKYTFGLPLSTTPKDAKP